MSAISTILTRLRAAIWAIDVRDDIANAIEQCYSDVSNPTLKTEALEAALQNKIDQGEMAALTIGDHTITAAKLASGVIDNTLATSGAAADAKATGDALSALEDQFTEETDQLKADLGAYTWNRKGYINLTTDPVVLTPTANTGIDCLVADCAAGDVFTVTASGGATSRAWGFLDSGNHVLTVADANTQVEGLEIAAPSNAVKLVLNNKFAESDGKVYKVGNNIESRLSTIEKGGSGLTDEAKEALLACFRSLASFDNGGAYEILRRALYGPAFRAVIADDIESHVGYDNISINNGTVTAQSVQSFAVMAYNKNHVRFTAPADYAYNRFVFKRTGNDYYANTGNTNVFLFAKGTGKYTSTDVTAQGITDVTFHNGWNGVLQSGKVYDLILDTDNSVLSLSDSSGKLMTISNANTIGYWGANNAGGIGWKFVNAQVLIEEAENE